VKCEEFAEALNWIEPLVQRPCAASLEIVQLIYFKTQKYS